MTAQTTALTRMPKTDTLRLLDSTTERIVVMRGGTRSGKTFAILIVLCRWLFLGILRKRNGNDEAIDKGTALVVRKHAATLKGTVLKDFEQIVFAFASFTGIVPSYNKTNRTFSFQGRNVEFIGADDEQKLRGRKSNILYCNEANELSYAKEFFQLLMRCTGPVIMDFNPSDPYVWIKTELEDKRANDKGDVEVVVTTYKDNHTLKAVQIAEIENLEHTNPALWRVYGLGEYGVTMGLVIPAITLVEEWPDDVRLISGGLDFGFTNDPTSLYRFGERQVSETVSDGEGGEKTVTVHELYCDELIYETGLNEYDLIKRFKDIGVKKNFEIIADSSHPSTINALRRAGYNVRKAIKRPGSVRSGINQLRGYKIFVTKRSQGAIREQQTYKFKQHTNGNWLNDPVDANNHFWDCCRYRNTRFAKLKPFK